MKEPVKSHKSESGKVVVSKEVPEPVDLEVRITLPSSYAVALKKHLGGCIPVADGQVLYEIYDALDEALFH